MTAAEFLKAAVEQGIEAPQFDELDSHDQSEVITFVENIEFLIGGYELPQEVWE